MKRNIYSRSSKRQKLEKNLDKFRDESGRKKKDSSIEKKLSLILDSMGLFYTPEKFLKYKEITRCFDFYVTDGVNYFILIEADGSFWHGKNTKSDDLTYIQKKNKTNDRLKNKIAKELGIPLLRFWEEEIHYKSDYVINTIQEEIKRQKPE